MLVRIADRKDADRLLLKKQSDLGLLCLSGLFAENSVYKFSHMKC